MSESHTRSILKALSYRILGSTATGVVGWWISGSIKVGAAVGLADTAIKLVLYYVHERVWHRVKWGKVDPKIDNGGGI
jgi:uncharacterized membrane protein